MGAHLRDGIAALLGRIEPSLASRHGARLATAILKDPLVRETGGRMASFLHRSQFSGLCLSLAAKESGASCLALREALRGMGVAEPAETLDRIAEHALELEQARPELTELARHEMAVAAAAAPLAARINSCFEQTMDRVSARFTSSVRLITVTVALGLAAFLQIDCLELVNQLAMDTAARNRLVDAALAGRHMETSPAELRAATQVELAPVPGSWREWRAEWSEKGAAHAGGILLTAMLLSLGAPFWYGLLGGAIRLRPLVEARESGERRPPIPFPTSSSPASSARLAESDEWRPAPVSRYSAARR